MAILGIAIQSNTGIPLYLQTWSEKLTGFTEGNPILISGFLSAVSSFANNFKQKISYIRLFPSEHDDPFGVNAVYSFIGAYMILCFVDPYQFREMVNFKLDWIYSKVLSRYEDMIRVGKVPQLSDEELQFIQDILQDTVCWNKVDKKKNKLRIACNEIIKAEFPGEVYGINITSFDNSILFSHGVDREEVEIYLNNMARGHGLEDGEMLHNYVTLPGLEPRLLVMKNPGIRTKISDILRDVKADQGGLPFYYYLITDVNCAIEPIVESLTSKFNAILGE